MSEKDSTVLQTRVDEAAKVLKIKDLDEKNLKEKINSSLETIGIDDSDIGIKILEAETTTFEDFEKSFYDGESVKKSKLVVPITNSIIPIPRLKAAWEILKGNDPFKKKEEKLEFGQPDASLYATLRPIGQWADNELIEKYKEAGPIEIEDQLKRRSKGRPCIVFNEDGTVNEEDSLYMLRKARQHELPDKFKIREKLVLLYRVGEFPKSVFFECPVHRNVLLIDGYCDECGKTWDVNDYNKNVFIRLLMAEEDIDIRLYRKMSFEELKEEFPNVFIIYNDLNEEGKLPSLKKKSSKNVDGSDPFRVHKTY